MMTPSRALARLGELALGDDATEHFLCGNARRLFKI
jgi:hypothetical protein